MLKKISTLILSAALIAGASNTFAAEKASQKNNGISGKSIFSYNYFEGNLNYNEHGNNLIGLDAKASFGVMPNLSLQGGIGFATRGHHDTLNANFEAVFHMPVGLSSLKNTDFLAHGGVEYGKFKMGQHAWKTKDDDWGVIIGAGIRHQLIKNLEVFTDLSLHTAFESKWVASTGAVYSITENLQIGGKIAVSQVDTYSATLRFNF